MIAQLQVQSGARTGLVLRLSHAPVTLGRQPESDLQFHPEIDLEVSGRHAVLLPIGGQWVIRDLGSRNGTYVNGQRIYGDTWLRDGDRIRCGWNGPLMEFRQTTSADPLVHPTAWLPQLAAAPLPIPAPAAHAAESVATPHVHAAVARQTRRLRRVVGGLVLILVAVVGIALQLGARQRTRFEMERRAMQERIDSLLQSSEWALQAMRGEVEGLTEALRRSQDEVREVRTQLRRAEAGGDRSQVVALRRQLQVATLALDRQQTAAGLDFRGIERRNRPAVAMIYVEFADGEIVTATAFAVRPDATLLTSRHVVAGQDGARRTRKLAIQFADSEQVWPARVIATAPDVDLALVKVDNILGRVPVVSALSLRPDTVPAGSPVVLLGFPLGGSAAGSPGASATIARPLLTAGVVHAHGTAQLEILGYGAAGASGSPIFDANGEVIAVLFGGRQRAAERTLLAVPSTAVLRLLEGRGER